jgi:hypothetical protein
MGKAPESSWANQAAFGITDCVFSMGHCQAEGSFQKEAKEQLKLARPPEQQLRGM